MSELIREEYPLPKKKTRQSILKTVEQIMAQSSVVRIELDARDATAQFWRVGTEEELKERNRSLSDILRNIPMDEVSYDPDNVHPPYVSLMEAFDILEDAGALPGYLVSGVGPQKLRSFFSISRRSASLYGVPILYLDRQDGDEVIYLCGSTLRDPEPLDLNFAVKVPLS